MADYTYALPKLEFYKAPDWAAADKKAADLQAANALLQEKQRVAAQSSASANALRSSGGRRARVAEAETVDPTEVRVEALDAAYAPFTRLVNRVQSPEDVAAFTTAVYSHPMLGSEATKIKPVDQAVQDSQKEFMADPDRWRMLHGNLDGKTIYQLSQAATAPKIEKIDLGGAIKFVDMNPKSATFKQEMGDFTKSPVPRAAAPEQTSGVVEPQINNLAPAPTTAAANASIRSPVQLAMIGGPGTSPLLQMTRPMPSEGGVTAPAEPVAPAPTKTSTRKPAAAETNLPPGLKLKQGERYNAEADRVEAVPGSDLYITQSQKHQKDAKAVQGVARKSEEAIQTIDKILSPENTDAFANNFGGYTAYATRLQSGDVARVRNALTTMASNLKAAGLEEFRTGGSIGAMTEKEWPIVEKQIASLSPEMSAEDARKTITDIKRRLSRMRDDAHEIYSDTWGQTQYYRKPKDAPSSLDDLLEKYK
jgi:hypothetical protein